jgi:hypothetical protein
MIMRLMKTQFTIFVVAFLLITPAAFSTTSGASTEEGEWISYPLDYPSLGGLAVCGEDCIGVAAHQTTMMLFFDTNRSAWSKLEFETEQTIHDLQAEGHTVFAYTDDLLIGYSAITSSFNTRNYNGTLLKTYYQNPSYGCGANLAFFVTEQMMYVFDAEWGIWQEYDYGLPADYGNYSYYVIKDDYLWAVIYRGISGEKPPENVVYSLHTHSFNQLENGCYDPYAALDHGFARWHEHGNENYTLVGYSAFTNEFDVVQVVGQGYLCFSNVAASGLNADNITAYAVSFRVVIEPYVLVRADFYGYDTRIGSWSYTTVDIRYDEGERYSGSWQHGGQFVLDMSIKTGEIYNFILYSGVTGQFSINTPGLTYHSVTSGTPRGGEVLVVYDIDDAWGYSFATEEGSRITMDKPNTAGFPLCGEDFIVFNRYDDVSETMTTYIYNSKTNRWTTTMLPKQVFLGAYLSNEHIFVISSDNPTRETIFYSSFIDTYVKRDFPAESYIAQSMGYALAWVSSDQKSYLFDAQTGIIHQFDFEFTQNGLGDFAASFFNNQTLYGYSALSGQWSNITITDSPYTCLTKGSIGLISTYTGTIYYNKYYVYSSLTDNWVELASTGDHRGICVGEKTALVIRSNSLYAFDPDGRTSPYEYWIKLDRSTFPLSITTNSTISNFSFNQSSKAISFNVTGQDSTGGFCNLTLPNTLVEGLWNGSFTVLIDGEEPTQVSSWTDGTYTYLYFIYVHSEHGVTIISEFPNWVLMSLLLVIFAGATVIYKQRLMEH